MRLSVATTVFVGVAAFALWLAADAMTGSHDPSPRPSEKKLAIDVRGEELAGEIARLHERLAPAVAPVQAGRNLFLFHQAPPPRREVAAKPALSEALAIPLPPPPPPLKLIGIAEDAGADGPVRTAIISGMNEVYTVREGQHVTPRFRVTKIAGDAVELEDAVAHSTLRLALR
jgi:hypothetical protein